MDARPLVAVFARAPVAGRVKTRLIPAIGATRAAKLHARLVRAAVRTARAAHCGPVELHASEPHSFFAFAGAPVRLQRGADLGDRMHHAVACGLRRHRGVILIGSDAPALRPHDLRQAARLLHAGYDAVLSPAEDGGYALIALSRVSPSLFREIAWGTSLVWAQTVARLEAAGYRWRAVRKVWDVDRPEDLRRLEKVRRF